MHAFPPCPIYHPNLTLERPTVEKHVFFSQLTQIVAFTDPVEYDFIYQEKKNPGKKMPVLAVCTPSHVRTKLNPYGN